MKNIVIQNPGRLENIKKKIFNDGVKKLHVLADFDRTLTTAFIDGENVPSLISILRDGNYLTPDYTQKAKDLYARYHPIEITPEISLKEKKKTMQEWWMSHFDLLIRSGLNKKDLEKVAQSGKVKLRDGFGAFIDLLHTHNVPLVILSSSGLGGDVISMYLEKEGKLYDNVYVLSNSYEWDEDGNAVAFKRPIIHVMNKDETAIQDFPVFNTIKNRTNVLLLGDSLGDVGMIKGFDYDNLIKVGFLNENIEENLETYKQNYDVLILRDSPMDYVNELLKEIVKIYLA